MIGTDLLHYKILDRLGAGGMGEVYRARDTRLGREVALKVLPEDFARDGERLARFRREAKVLASLQHPNIAGIFGLEEADGRVFLAMELAPGADLTERIAKGPIPEEEVLDIARQIAAGLEEAHEQGVVHRDLKPANLRLGNDGAVKILDFGLARAFAGETTEEDDIEHSPTITAMHSQEGVILGTAAYMSPEQARGKSVDRRADIWSFGVVLFEMLSGKRLFQEETTSDTLAAVLRADIEWDQLPADTSPALRRLLERSLERDPRRRLRDIGEARVLLEDGLSDSSLLGAPSAVLSDPDDRPTGGIGTRERWAWIAGVVALLAVAAFALRPGPATESHLVQATLMPPEGWDFTAGAPFAVSPDGRSVAYVAGSRPENTSVPLGTSRIWIRELDRIEARPLADVDGGGYPFWSPDGRWLGFFADGKLNKIEARGGPVIPLCNATDGRGGSWNKDGVIVFQDSWNKPMSRVPAAGGTPQPATAFNEEQSHVAHRWPHFLPDGRHFLYYVVSTNSPETSEHSGVHIGSLDSQESRLLMKGESRAMLSRGHLIYRAGSTLMARPFDTSSRTLTGEAVPISEDIPGGAVSWGGASFGVTEAGVLVHIRGDAAADTRLNWRDRDGTVVNTIVERGVFADPALSHDGTRFAISIGEVEGDIWIFELDSGAQTRFSFDVANEATPVWSPDDRRIAYTSNNKELHARLVSGHGDPEHLFTGTSNVSLSDWSPDGRYLLFSQDGDSGTERTNDVWALDLTTSEAFPLVQGPYEQWEPHLSPDGKWLAYISDESGKFAMYVQSFPEGEGRRIVSRGDQDVQRPRWSGDGEELFYRTGGTIHAVPVSSNGGLTLGAPTVLFSVKVNSNQWGVFDVSFDGEHFLTNDVPPAETSGAQLMLNWPAALER